MINWNFLARLHQNVVQAARRNLNVALQKEHQELAVVNALLRSGWAKDGNGLVSGEVRVVLRHDVGSERTYLVSVIGGFEWLDFVASHNTLINVEAIERAKKMLLETDLESDNFF